MKKHLAIVTTHPIQYNAPLFKLLYEKGRSFTIKVFYTWSQSQQQVADKEFGLQVKWDIELLEGYEYTFIPNTSSAPGSHHFNGIVNPTLQKEIEAWNADAILVYGWAFSSHLKAIRYFHNKIPVLFRGDSTLLDEPEGFSFKKWVKRIFLRWVYSSVDYAFYVGSANKTYFRTLGLKDKQLLFAPHAIDNNRFRGKSDEYDMEAKKWRINLGIGEAEVVFLFAGKLTQKKDPELLIRAFIEFNNKSTKLVMVGNGELKNDLKEKYKCFPGIIFLDFQNQSVMPVVYRLGDIFVLPSKGPGETWGLAVNEAMACSRAVIVSDKCGCSVNLVRNGENGYTFRSGDVQSLKSSMELSVRNCSGMGEKSAAIIEEWNYCATINQIKTLFEKTV